MGKKIGILQFPASNCDRDVFKAIEDFHPEFIPSNSSFDIKRYGAFILPGGFSYGDYLRPGALASFSAAVKDLIRAGQRGWPILGICNGFQILCETRLLEGVLLPNQGGRFIDEWTELKLETENHFWPTGSLEFQLPIAHGEGSYYISAEKLKKLKSQGQIWLSYKKNPNGSTDNIAGITNERGNIAGLMPHPERAVSERLGSSKGCSFFQRLREWI